MLLNEFLKEHRKVEQLERTIVQQQKDFESALVKQQKQIGALMVGLEEVRNELPVGKAAPPMIASN